VTRVLARVATWLALALATGLVVPATAADATSPTPFVAVGHSPTQGTPVPGAYLTADFGAWTSSPESYEFQWFRDGTAIAGATTRDYLVQVADIGHTLAPEVTGHSGPDTADFVGTAMIARKITATLTLDVRRVHPAPDRMRLVWTAISFMTTERPWDTDGGTVVAYKKKDGQLKELGRAVATRGASFVRMPWKRAPSGRTSVTVCYLGSDVVEESCSPYVVVRRGS
jgi:hypothetical protein